jgi:hypothetical protein
MTAVIPHMYMTAGSDRIIKQIYGSPPVVERQREAFLCYKVYKAKRPSEKSAPAKHKRFSSVYYFTIKLIIDIIYNRKLKSI